MSTPSKASPSPTPLNRYVYWAVSILMILYFCIKFNILKNRIPGLYNEYEFTEFLINYEGGFVRRGLIGQGLFELVKITGWNIYNIITIFSISVFFIVMAFFFYKFWKRKLNWWLLLSPFAFGFCTYVIRKDFLCYAITILVLYILRKQSYNSRKSILATLLIIFGLFVHEAYIFFGAPIAVLLMFSGKGSKIVPIICCIGVVLTFFVLSFFKGNLQTAHTIYSSWLPFIDNPDYLFKQDNSIGALGWDTVATFKFHLIRNFRGELGTYNGLIIRPLYVLLIYYFVSNILFVFKKTNDSFTLRDKTYFSAILLGTFVTLIPMFTILSCDYGRLYQYAVMTALAAIVIIPRERLEGVLPCKYLSFIEWFNARLDSVLIPTVNLFIILLLAVAPSQFSFAPLQAINNTVLYTDTSYMMLIVSKLLHFIW